MKTQTFFQKEVKNNKNAPNCQKQLGAWWHFCAFSFQKSLNVVIRNHHLTTLLIHHRFQTCTT